ncbi:MAG TPA: hypothetical protein VF195_02555 [Actinomycetota bacterium]
MIEGRSVPPSAAAPRSGPTRFVQLIAGLVLFGASLALLVRSELGLDPWDVFHQGLSVATGLSIGVSTIAAGVVVLLLWIPLRQRPGIGTVANVVLVGLSLDAVLLLIPATGDLALRWIYLVTGIVLNGIATGAYIGAGLGPGPRDGLMVGLARGGRSLRVVRTAIEVSVLVVGWLLGGTVGIGTVLFASTIGPIVHLTVPAFSRGPGRDGRADVPEADPGASH